MIKVKSPFYKTFDENSFQKEEKFIISCVNAVVAGQKFPVEGVDLKKLDWNRVINLSAIHRVIPTVGFTILNISTTGIPAEVKLYFSDACMTIGLNNFYLTTELLSILNLSRENNIAAIPLKGPLLSVMAYGNIGLREFTDIDILVRKPDLPNVVKRIFDAGYKSEWLGTGLMKFENECEFLVNKFGRISKLDIHWKVIEDYYGTPYSSDELIARSVEKIFVHSKILLPRTEDVLLCTIMHHGKNDWKELRYIADLAGLISQQKAIDWKFVSLKSKELGLEGNLMLGIYLATRMFFLENSDETFQSFKANPAIMHIGNRILKQYFSDLTDYTPGEIKFNFSAQQKLNPRVNYFFFLKQTFFELIRPKVIDVKGMNLPQGFYFIYYFRRFFRLLKTYGIRRLFFSVLKLMKASIKAALKYFFGKFRRKLV